MSHRPPQAGCAHGGRLSAAPVSPPIGRERRIYAFDADRAAGTGEALASARDGAQSIAAKNKRIHQRRLSGGSARHALVVALLDIANAAGLGRRSLRFRFPYMVGNDNNFPVASGRAGAPVMAPSFFTFA